MFDAAIPRRPLAFPVFALTVFLFYYHTGESWWYPRFILPAFPALLHPAEMEAFRAAIPGEWEVIASSGSNRIGKWHPPNVEP